MDNELVSTLVDALRVLADIPVEDFNKQGQPDFPLMVWNGHMLTVGHVLKAREAIDEASYQQGKGQ